MRNSAFEDLVKNKEGARVSSPLYLDLRLMVTATNDDLSTLNAVYA